MMMMMITQIITVSTSTSHKSHEHKTKRCNKRQSPPTHLNITVDEPINFKVIIVLTKGVDEGLCHLQPAHVEEELQYGEDGEVEINVVLWVILLWVKELASHDGGHEEGVHCQTHHLQAMMMMKSVMKVMMKTTSTTTTTQQPPVLPECRPEGC